MAQIGKEGKPYKVAEPVPAPAIRMPTPVLVPERVPELVPVR